MSWKDKINLELSIQTGDGKEFKPLWKDSVKKKDFNTKAFNFIDVEGTFVDRKKGQGSKFSLTFWFQGEDNIDQSDEFEASAADSRPWQVKHPIYGNLFGQPVSMERNDSNYNSTQFTVDFWESISDNLPVNEVLIKATIKKKTEILGELAAENYAIKIEPTFSDSKTLQDNILQISGSVKQLLDDSNFSEYQLAANKALKTANDIVAAPLEAMLDVQQLTLLPSLYSNAITLRIESLGAAYRSMNGLITSLDNRSDKLFYEANGATIIAAMCQASVEPLDSDYTTSIEIRNLSDFINDTLADYLANLDLFQVQIGQSLDVFIADDVTQLSLQDLVAQATENLFRLAFDAKQERRVVVAKGTNLILLTHLYMGLDASDKNIEEFRQVNQIKNEELFFVKKDRILTYFV